MGTPWKYAHTAATAAHHLSVAKILREIGLEIEEEARAKMPVYCGVCEGDIRADRPAFRDGYLERSLLDVGSYVQEARPDEEGTSSTFGPDSSKSSIRESAYKRKQDRV